MVSRRLSLKNSISENVMAGKYQLSRRAYSYIVLENLLKKNDVKRHVWRGLETNYR